MALLTIDEAALRLRVKVSWLYERTRTNEVPHLKLGKYLRFDEDELQAWAAQFRRDGRGRRSSRLASRSVEGPRRTGTGRSLG